MKHLLVMLALSGAVFAQTSKERFEKGLEKLNRSGQLAQQGKFAEAQPLMNEAFAEIDAAVSSDPDNVELRMFRGKIYSQLPPFLNKAAIAREDLEVAARNPNYKEAAEEALATLAPGSRPKRFPQIKDDASPVLAVASVTFDGKVLRSRADLPPALAQLMRGIETCAGFLGSHILFSADQPGMILFFTWWKDKQSLAAFVDGPLHQGVIREVYSKTPTGSGAGSSQIAVELFLPLPGSMRFNGGLTPKTALPPAGR